MDQPIRCDCGRLRLIDRTLDGHKMFQNRPTGGEQWLTSDPWHLGWWLVWLEQTVVSRTWSAASFGLICPPCCPFFTVPSDKKALNVANCPNLKRWTQWRKKRENKLHLSSTITDWPDKPFRRCSTGIFVGFFFGLEPLPTHWRDLIRTITSERRTD